MSRRIDLTNSEISSIYFCRSNLTARRKNAAWGKGLACLRGVAHNLEREVSRPADFLTPIGSNPLKRPDSKK
jgi:hypothetical protein